MCANYIIESRTLDVATTEEYEPRAWAAAQPLSDPRAPE